MTSKKRKRDALVDEKKMEKDETWIWIRDYFTTDRKAQHEDTLQLCELYNMFYKHENNSMVVSGSVPLWFMLREVFGRFPTTWYPSDLDIFILDTAKAMKRNEKPPQLIDLQSWLIAFGCKPDAKNHKGLFCHSFDPTNTYTFYSERWIMPWSKSGRSVNIISVEMNEQGCDFRRFSLSTRFDISVCGAMWPHTFHDDRLQEIVKRAHENKTPLLMHPERDTTAVCLRFEKYRARFKEFGIALHICSTTIRSDHVIQLVPPFQPARFVSIMNEANQDQKQVPAIITGKKPCFDTFSSSLDIYQLHKDDEKHRSWLQKHFGMANCPQTDSGHMMWLPELWEKRCQRPDCVSIVNHDPNTFHAHVVSSVVESEKKDQKEKSPPTSSSSSPSEFMIIARCIGHAQTLRKTKLEKVTACQEWKAQVDRLLVFPNEMLQTVTEFAGLHEMCKWAISNPVQVKWCAKKLQALFVDNQENVRVAAAYAYEHERSGDMAFWMWMVQQYAFNECIADSLNEHYNWLSYKQWDPSINVLIPYNWIFK